jgi:pimeloyl-ACP methyl ester carboxylesterase
VAAEIKYFSNLTVCVARPETPRGKPPVLLIHGMFAGAWAWEKYQPYLAQHGYESYAINLRGRDGSRPVQDIGQTSLMDYVADAAEVATALNNPIVMGHSMGGLVAQKLAEAGKCRAMILIASAAPRGIPLASWLLIKNQAKRLRALLLSEALPPDRKEADLLVFNRTPPDDSDRSFALMSTDSGRVGRQLSIGVIAVQESRIKAPVLVMTGLDDRLVPPRVARALARKYRAELREYAGLAHNILAEPGWERPCADAVAWMDRVCSVDLSGKRA